jgi:hypothetical protein
MKKVGMALLVAGLGSGAMACSDDLPVANVVDGVRILATSADKPYAAPGETVSLRVLAVDGRAEQTQAMRVFWLPTVCMNPAGDDYFGCYPAFANEFRPGVDLSSVLLPGEQRTFSMPTDAIATAVPHPGESDPYGLAFAFVAACAGHLEYVPVDTTSQSPLTTPFGCFDDSHTALGADQFVFAFTRVYAFADRRNANPVLDHLTFGGVAVDPAAGITLPHCTGSDQSKCSKTDVDAVVPDSSWEEDPGSLSPSGGPAHESIWVDYYATGGRFENDSSVLFDARSGRASSSADGYAPPLASGPRTLWAVVHDTRGGASWTTIPVNVQ